MVIYAEYLFLENALAGLVVLLLTKKFCGCFVSWNRLAVGSILCGLYSFILLLESLPWWGVLLSKLAFSVGIVVLTFPCNRWKRLGRTLLIFYLISFAMGGIAIGLMYFFHLSGVTASGTFYIGRITYLQVFFGIALTWVGLSLFASFLKERTHIGRKGVEVRVTIGTLEVDLKGMVDTGNFLLDPSTGKPVSLISLEAIKKLIPEMDQINQGKIHWIPYQAVGQTEGMLVGIVPDQVVILDEKNGSWRTDFILAVYKGTFPTGWDGEKIDLLLHPAVLEGGILEGEELEY